MAYSQTFKYIENSLEHWITFIYTTDSEAVETEAAVYTTHHDEYFELPPYLLHYGPAVAQWVRCCATNRKVAGSIPDVVIETFH